MAFNRSIHTKSFKVYLSSDPAIESLPEDYNLTLDNSKVVIKEGTIPTSFYLKPLTTSQVSEVQSVLFNNQSSEGVDIQVVFKAAMLKVQYGLDKLEDDKGEVIQSNGKFPDDVLEAIGDPDVIYQLAELISNVSMETKKKEAGMT